ncbi:DUF7562 family protein [Natrinema gelatinilyticum]|uniref:DUF7562 family protein n=1 Tax=Natrinema gelatinilyticum TaxID=2961571 RepID=UPI0020C41879|nr:hypothetical protein [Natrinema gelatinilyticum]
MWPSRNRTETVICLACGTERPRDETREYDKYGDRWDREDKTFEYLCKSCHRELCHHPRDDLEELLIDLEAGNGSRDAFLASYLASVEERYGPLEER